MRNIFLLAVCFIVSISSGVINMQANAADTAEKLSQKERAMVKIAVLTSSGRLDGLKTALNEGLDRGLTINEIKELLVQAYAYAGFPRSLNGLTVFQTVTQERQARGIADEQGKEASPLPADRTSLEFGTANQTKLFGQEIKGGLYEFAPLADVFLKAHLFGDIFQRDILTWKERELITIALLAGIEGVDPQLSAHLATSAKVGYSDAQLLDFAEEIRTVMGDETGERVKVLVEKIIR